MIHKTAHQSSILRIYCEISVTVEVSNIFLMLALNILVNGYSKFIIQLLLQHLSLLICVYSTLNKLTCHGQIWNSHWLEKFIILLGDSAAQEVCDRFFFLNCMVITLCLFLPHYGIFVFLPLFFPFLWLAQLIEHSPCRYSLYYSGCCMCPPYCSI